MREVSDDDEDDQDDDYRVFGRMTMKAQSEALYEVTLENGEGKAGKAKTKGPPMPSPIKE